MTRYDIIFQFTSTAAKQTKVLKVLHGFTEKIIKDRRERISQNNNNSMPLFLDILSRRSLMIFSVNPCKTFKTFVCLAAVEVN